MTGKDLYDLSIQHIGEPYLLGSLVPKNNADYHGNWDCAEFISWLVYQTTGKLYGCANNNSDPASADAYTGFWKRDADKLGTSISVEQAAKTLGAAILRYSGSGIVGHIVLSDGKGGTVEAHSHKDGVIRSVVSGRRWDIGILVPWISYEQTAGEVPVATPSHILYRFTDPLMKGDKVREIQEALISKGIPTSADGIFGLKTFQAVRSFQEKNDLLTDGEVGSKTAEALGIQL